MRQSITATLFIVAVFWFGTEQTQAQRKQKTDTTEWTRDSLLTEVSVASRTPKRINNIPHSVFVLSAKTLQRDLAVSSDITDILGKEVPGLAPGAQTGNSTGQSLRGRNALIMIDGISQSSPLRNGEVDMRSIDAAAIERIEVIKGATAIYGNGAAGGIINYVTKSASTEKGIHGQTNLNITGGLAHSANTFGGRIGQLLSGTSGRWNYLANINIEQTGEYKDAKGHIVSPNYSLGETNFSNVLAKVGYKISDKQQIIATYNFNRSQQHTNFQIVNGNFLTQTPTTGVLGPQTGVPTGTRGNHNAHIQYNNAEVWRNTSLVADAYYTHRNEVFYYSPGRFDAKDGQSLLLDEKKGLRAALNSKLVTSDNNNLSLTYGMDVLNNVTSQPLLDGRIWVPKMHMTNLAPFMEMEWIWKNDFIFNGGFRFENTKIKVDDYTTLRITNPNGSIVSPSINVTGGNLKYDASLFNAGIRYNHWRAFTPFVSFSQGFSVADIGLALRASQVNNINKINTQAVKVNNYEVGIISDLNKLHIEASGFYSTSKLGIEDVLDVTTGQFTVNRTPEHVYGFEVLANYKFNQKLEANGTFSYTEGKQDTANNGHFNYYMSGRRIAAPKVTAYINYSPIEKLNLRLQYMGILSRNRFQPLPSGLYSGYNGPVKDYHLFNLSGFYSVNKNTIVTVGIDNLFNRDYFPARSQFTMINSLYSKGRGSSFNLGVIIKY